MSARNRGGLGVGGAGRNQWVSFFRVATIAILKCESERNAGQQKAPTGSFISSIANSNLALRSATRNRGSRFSAETRSPRSITGESSPLMTRFADTSHSKAFLTTAQGGERSLNGTNGRGERPKKHTRATIPDGKVI